MGAVAGRGVAVRLSHQESGFAGVEGVCDVRVVVVDERIARNLALVPGDFLVELVVGDAVFVQPRLRNVVGLGNAVGGDFDVVLLAKCPESVGDARRWVHPAEVPLRPLGHQLGDDVPDVAVDGRVLVGPLVDVRRGNAEGELLVEVGHEPRELVGDDAVEVDEQRRTGGEGTGTH